MTVTGTTTKNSYVCDGTVGPFAFTYFVLIEAHLLVILRTIATGAEETLILNTDYTVDGEGNPAGGSITLIGDYIENPPEDTHKIFIIRNTTKTQLTDWINYGSFDAEVLEKAIDLLMMTIQELNEALSRVPILKKTGSATMEIPTARANKKLGFDGSGDLTLYD